MNHFPFHIGDYISHTRHLSLMEDLAYRRMLDHYYLHERPFNGRSTDVARLIGMRDAEAEVEAVLREFFVETDCGWSNPRADEEIERYREKCEKASQAGKSSGLARKIRKREQACNGRSTDVQRTLNERATNHNQYPLVPEPGGDPRSVDRSLVGTASVPETSQPTAPSTRTGPARAADVAKVVLKRIGGME